MSRDLVVLAEPAPQSESSKQSKPEAPLRPPKPTAYFDVARAPVASLLFVLPLLAVYEIGVILGGQSLSISRNAADSWMRCTLLELGITRPWVLPALVIGTLVFAAIWRQQRITVSRPLLLGMLVECVVAAWGLVALGQCSGFLLKAGGLMSLSGDAQQSPAEWAATCVGAGLYEETLFRLWGLPIVYLGMRVFLVPRRIAFWVAICLTSLLFAGAHYLGVGFHGTGEEWFTFGFRLFAGTCFAALLLKRGFGVAVGTHVIYDATVLLISATMIDTVAG